MSDIFLGAHFISGAGQPESSNSDGQSKYSDEYAAFFKNAVDKHLVAAQLVRAVDGCRTDFVVLPLVELIDKLLVVENKDDLILILHEKDFENFSLHPLMKISTYLKIHGKFEG